MPVADSVGSQHRPLLYWNIMNRPRIVKVQQGKVSPRLALLTVLVIVFAIWFVRSNEGQATEYRLYLSEDRPAIELRYDELAESWTEQTLKNRFPKLPIRCYSDSSHGLGDRVCALDVVSNNRIPTMFISFFFAKGQLTAVSFNIPWWTHGDAFDDIVANFGQPHAGQFLPYGGVRLYGWKLPTGAAIFYNRDRPLNPLQWNSVFWNSPELCARQRCFSP